MADTHGFEVVLEAREAVLQKALRGAWKSAECPDTPGDEGRIPEYLDVPPGTAVGGFVVADGQVQIPQDELDAHMAPDVNGAELKLGLKIQLQVQSPPVPSAGLWDMTADVKAKVPVGTLPDTKNVGLLLDGLPRGNVSVVLTSGDPLAAKLDTLLAEFAHKSYENGSPGVTPDPKFPTIPHTATQTNVFWGFAGIGGITVDVYTEIYDDLSDPVRQIKVTRTGAPPNQMLEISLPLYLRIYNIRATGLAAGLGLADPMGIETQLIVKAPFDSPPGAYTIHFDTATVDTGPIAPAPGIEGTNYTDNKAKLSLVNLDNLLKTEIKNRGQQMIDGFADQFTIIVPTVAQIETAIGDLFHQELESRDYIALWTPEVAGSTLDVTDVTVKALADALAIAINAGGGANANALTTFVPADREFGVAIDGAKIQQVIDKTRVDNGFADSDLPKRMKSDDDDVDLRELDVFLVDGAIRMTGAVTVIDAILGSIDVDADFRVDVGLHWVPNAALSPAGGQTMEETILDQDVDPEESVLLWVITAILAVITFGAGSVLGAVIIIVVALIVQAIVESIGGDKLVDGVTGALQGITAWPPNLSRIGRVRAVFHDPVVIEANGLVIAGTLEVLSSCESVEVLAARSAGAYSAPAASPLSLAAVNTSPAAAYRWLPGDGTPEVAAQSVLHTYAASGIYIAKHKLTILEAGGATSRHFALVDVKNVIPVVDAGLDITVKEGEVVTLVGHFTDVEYPDTHESSWNFGDDQAPLPGVIAETNAPPQAAGTSTVQHAWCDNGEYVVTLRVRDQNGGMATDTRTVTVLNVPPVVDAGPAMYAYRCSVITLTGKFTDPGWCDTHTGSWDFGDCSPPQTATIIETHEPPAGEGVIIASHGYERCGTYHVVCTVVDDDGGVGQAATVVEVVDVENKDFEGGYRRRLRGIVANAWEPYTAPPPSTSAAAAGSTAPGAAMAAGTHAAAGGPGDVDLFDCEECVVHGGQRSQRILAGGAFRAGIYQRIGANPQWEYQISAWYAIDERVGGMARLGIDPAGGTDPAAPSVVWSAGQERREWAQLTVRAIAESGLITVFLEALGVAKVGEVATGADLCFDDVDLIPIQPFCPEEEPERPKREELCVDFVDLQPGTEIPPVHERKGFTFTMLDHKPGRIVGYGPPPGVAKLQLGRGVLVDLPFAADWVRARVAPMGRMPVELVAVDEDGRVVGQASTDPAGDPEQELLVEAGGIARVQIAGKGFEATLIEICAGREGKPPDGDRPGSRLQPSGRIAVRGPAATRFLPERASGGSRTPGPTVPAGPAETRSIARSGHGH